MRGNFRLKGTGSAHGSCQNLVLLSSTTHIRRLSLKPRDSVEFSLIVFVMSPNLCRPLPLTVYCFMKEQIMIIQPVLSLYKLSTQCFILQAHFKRNPLFLHSKKPSPRPPNSLIIQICDHAIHAILLPPSSLPHKKARSTFSTSYIIHLGILNTTIK